MAQASRPSDKPGYLFDRDAHSTLVFELIDPAGRSINMCQMKAPLNKDASAQIALRTSIAHECGCRRELQTTPLRCY
jgi:hypothetical protein